MSLNQTSFMLALAVFLFTTGLLVLIIRRNVIAMLLGLELMLNSANINLVAFNQLHPLALHGQIFALFIMLVAVCEAAVGIALILRMHHFYQTSLPDKISDLRESA